MYQFYYDCVGKYIDRSDFQYIETDTDSAYIALTGNFEDLIKPELRETFELDKYNWFPRTDIAENKADDKRKPGLLKIEFEGDGIVALCSKAYFVWREKCKYSCEGSQKSRIGFIKEQYIQCLTLNQPNNCTNVGFRKHNGQIKTYEQNKIGLTPIYTKGVLLNIGIKIAPLNV